MSTAYASALHISFDVRGGLFVRQVHHWAALLFVAAMVAHMFRTFFTGAFRKPREANWIIGLVLILVGTFEGFTGYSLPDDLLSGTGLRIASGITLSVPVIGTWTQWALFGSEFPGTEILPRLYIIHVLLLPGVLLALIGVHVGLVWYQKHTQFPGPGRTEGNVVGVRILPAFAAKGGAFFAVTVGVHRACWAACSRSTRSGTSARTTRPTCPRAPSRTSTWAGRTAWPDCSPPGRSWWATTASRRCSGPPPRSSR